MASGICRCLQPQHNAQLVVVTGAPGSGKTAVLALMRHVFCEHVVFLPDAARIVLGSRFPRVESAAGRRAVQRAIFRVQRELERMAIDERTGAVVVCDRGTVDGSAYWPMDTSSYFAENETSHAAELARYRAVIDLRLPPAHLTYDPTNAARIERMRRAAEVDASILSLWKEHPHRYVIDAEGDFLTKATQAVAALNELVPSCCRPRRGVDVDRESTAGSTTVAPP